MKIIGPILFLVFMSCSERPKKEQQAPRPLTETEVRQVIDSWIETFKTGDVARHWRKYLGRQLDVFRRKRR